MPVNITDQDAQYAYDLVKAICTQVGPGLPGTDQERQRAGVIKQALESHLGAENVAWEEFTLAPRAFQGVLRTGALFMLVAALLNISIGHIPGVPPWLSTASSLIFGSLGALLVLFETILYREFIDPILPQKKSVNVIGRLRKPGATNVKRLLILSGHHDSALEFTWLRFLNKLKRQVYPVDRQISARENSGFLFLGYIFLVLTLTMFIGLAVMPAISLIQLVGVLLGNVDLLRLGTLGWVLLVYPIVPSIILGLTYTRGWKNGGNVPGAADNLSASAVAVAMCRFLVENPAYIPNDTEIRFISFGSEEAGIRGSRRYVERHKDELAHLDARVLNYEVVAYPEISILTTDVTGVRNDPGLVKSLAAAAVRAGVPYHVEANPTSGGGSDAGSFSQVGLKAVNLMLFKMPHQMVAFYHQKWDSYEVLTLEPLMNALKITIEWVRSGGE